MDAFEVHQQISPLALAKAELKKRKRSRNYISKKPESTDW
jgi:hypothetical protein